MPAGLGFIVQDILGMMWYQSLLHVGALSVRYTSHTHHHLIRIFIFTLHKHVYILNQLISLTQ